MDIVIAAYLGWFTAQAGLSVPEHPSIRFGALNEMSQRFGLAVNAGLELQALYNRTERAIYLPQGWQFDDLRHRSALLHELVHHVQNFNDIMLPCIAAYERQAFELQIRWLREQGVADPYGLIGTNELGINLVSVCRD